jgi:hypothetical protein
MALSALMVRIAGKMFNACLKHVWALSARSGQQGMKPALAGSQGQGLRRQSSKIGQIRPRHGCKGILLPVKVSPESAIEPDMPYACRQGQRDPV